jgi:hypothetical protein
MISPGRRFSIELAITEMEQKALKFYFRSKQFLEVVRYEFGISTSLPERELLLKAIADDYKSRIDIFNSGKNEDED